MESNYNRNNLNKLIFPKFVDFPSNIINTYYTPNDYGKEIQQIELDYIDAKKAWSFTNGNSNIVVGITDGPFNVNHPELQGTITSTHTSSSNGHGTLVACALAGNTNNDNGLASIGYNISLKGVEGSSTPKILSLAQEDIKVVNGSWL